MNQPSATPEAWHEISLTIDRNLADAVSNFIIDNLSSGIVLEDEEDAADIKLKFYIATNDDRDFKTILNNYLSQVIEGKAAPEITSKVIQNIEWTEQYKQSIRPSQITSDMIVRPPWVIPPESVKYDLIIEPKMAFGTGTHETTRSCLRVIHDRFQSGTRFLDLGTGSGVLAILADKIGASYIKAIDYDMASIENTHENFKINGVSTPNEIVFGSIQQCEGDEPYDFVAVNIIKSTIIHMIEKLNYLLAEKGTMILSGLLENDVEEISAELNRNGLTDFSTIRDNEWYTFIVNKR